MVDPKKKKKQKEGTKVVGFNSEEEEDPNFDEFVANYEKDKKDNEDQIKTEIKLHEMEKGVLELEISNLVALKDRESPKSNSSRSSKIGTRGRRSVSVKKK